MSNQQDQAKIEAFQTQTTATLQSLTVLIEKALLKAAQAPEERFVVRERVATVLSQPAHGSAVEVKLMPNEVVRAIDKNSKWVEVEYYHWLREEYRTGWVLKKYLERVPVNYTQAARKAKPTKASGVLSPCVRVQAGKRLAALGGLAPGMADVPRRSHAVVPE